MIKSENILSKAQKRAHRRTLHRIGNRNNTNASQLIKPYALTTIKYIHMYLREYEQTLGKCN